MNPRRRFQFSLWTLFVVVTAAAVACGYVAREWRIVQQRKEMLTRSPVVAISRDDDRDGEIPVVRRWLGDHFCRFVYVRQAGDIAPYEVAFPEANVAVPLPGRSF